MAPQTRSVPIQEYIAERTGILTNEHIAQYIEELLTNERVLDALLTSADREASMSLAPQEQIDLAHITSGHALNFLRRQRLPDKGLQDLQQAQNKFAKARLKEV